MKEEVVVLIVEDDDGHARLIEKNLRRACINNEMLRFADGQQILDFLFRRGEGRQREDFTPYLLLLDIRIPKIHGVEVLRQIGPVEKGPARAATAHEQQGNRSLAHVVVPIRSVARAGQRAPATGRAENRDATARP